jgi:hypothetical protein
MSIQDEMNAGRSWTDAITNEVVLRGMDGMAYLKWFAKRTTKIESVIPQFMHEFTHHWCFNSSVGRAIALLRMRAAFSMLFKGTTGEDDAALDISKYTACTILLKPITEGLALFAECDTYPGQSKVVSEAILGLQMCFGFPIAGERGQEITLLALLQGTRMTPDFLSDRKTRLYFKPFDIDDAYLPGYLCMKALNSRLKLRVPGFFDPDLFLSFVRTYVYEDCLLVEALLSDEKDELRAAEAVARRINSRFAELIEDEELPSHVECFEKSIADGQQEVAMTDGIGISSEDRTRLGEKLAWAATNLVRDAPKEDEHMRLAAGVVFTSLKLRRFMVVAAAPVKISGNVDGNLDAMSIDGEKLATIPNDQAGSTVGQQRDLLVVIDASSNCLFQVIKGIDDVRVVRELSARELAAGANLEELVQFVMTRDLKQQITDLLEDELAAQIKESWLNTIVNHITSNTVRLATELYLSLATLNVKDEELARVKGLLLEKGLRPFIREDPTLARVLAGIGLANMVSAQVSTIVGLSGAFFRLDPDVVRESIERLRINNGLPLLIGSNENVFALV